MGDRGPAKTPKNILDQRGSWRGKKRDDTLQVKPGTPTKPDWIGQYANIAWGQLLKKLEAMNVLAEVDGDALVNYCVLWGEWRKAAEFIEENGQTYETVDANDNTVSREYPQVKTLSTIAAQLLRIQGNFGLTPSARSNIKLPDKEKPKDGSEQYLKIS